MGLLSAIFGGNKPEENQQEKQEQKNFEILKYDGIRARNMNRMDYALRCLEQAAALRDDEETLRMLADCYVRVQRLDDARITLDKLVELNPDNVQAWLYMARVCYLQEDYESMDKACRHALAQDEGNATAHYLAGKAAYGLHDDLHAIVMLTKALALDEEFAAARLQRAEVLWHMKQANEALEDVDKVLELNSEEEDALLLKATLLAVLGREEEAMECLDRVVEIDPFNEKAYMQKAEMLQAKGEWAKSIDLYTEALELMPENDRLYQERGRAKLTQGDKDGAVADMQKAIELNPENEQLITGRFETGNEKPTE